MHSAVGQDRPRKLHALPLNAGGGTSFCQAGIGVRSARFDVPEARIVSGATATVNEAIERACTVRPMGAEVQWVSSATGGV